MTTWFFKEQARDARLRSRFGITIYDYERMLDAQGGVCWICSNPPSYARLHVDHCHETGKVRGLLCAACNQGLGWFKDDPNRMYFASLYLAGEAKHELLKDAPK